MSVVRPGQVNIFGMVKDLMGRDQNEQIFRAVVTDIDGDLVRILRTGETTGGNQYYPSLGGAAGLSVSDEVVVLRLGAGYVVIGLPIMREPGEGGG